MKLHAINKDIKTTLWCGPAALAAITGKPVSHIMQTIKNCTGMRRVQGMWESQLRKVALRYGISLETILQERDFYPAYNGGVMKAKPTLAKWLRENKSVYAEHPVILTVGHHFVTVHGRRLIDNHTMKPVSLKSAPHRRARVRHVMVAKPAVAVPVAAPAAAEIKPYVNCVPVRLTVQEHRALNTIAALHGVHVERHEFNPGERWVFPPSGLESEELDPHYGDHLAYDLKETLCRARQYARLNATVSCLMEQ